MAGAGLVRKAMKRYGGTQEEFARDVLYVSRRTLCRILAGNRPLKTHEARWLRLQITVPALSSRRGAKP